MASKPKNGHTGGPNPPDYVCPKRRGRRPFTIYLPPEIKAAMLETARRNGTTMQDAGEQLCEAYVETGGKLLDFPKTQGHEVGTRLKRNVVALLGRHREIFKMGRCTSPLVCEGQVRT